MKPFSIMLWVGALFIAIGVLTPHWFAAGYGDNSFHAGLYSNVECRGDEGCDTQLIVKYLGRGGGMSATISILLGLVMVLGGLATAVINTLTGFITQTRRGPAFVAMLMSAILGGLMILHLAIGRGLTHPGNWGYSLYLFVIGIGLSVAGGLMAMGAYPTAPRPMMMMGGMMPGMPGMPMMPQQGYPQQQQMMMQQQMLQQQYAQQQMLQQQYAQQQQQQQQQPPQAQPPVLQQPNCNQCGGPTVWNGQVGKLFCQPCNRFLA